MPNEGTNYSKNAVHDIRPKILFRKVETSFPDKNHTFNVMIPTSSIGGLTLLESSILVTLTTLLAPSEFFEFGTFHGATSVLLAANSAEHSRIMTVDLPRDSVVPMPSPDGNSALHLQNDVENDNYLRRSFVANGALYLDRADDVYKRKVRRLYCDSRTLDPVELGLTGRFDFIFIDGGHDFETVSIDTANALKMAKDDAVIIWHDYRSEIHREVTQFVDGFSRDNAVIHVEHTMLAFTLRGRFKNLI
jgi:predicted O-methyltransferase YrrM